MGRNDTVLLCKWSYFSEKERWVFLFLVKLYVVNIILISHLNFTVHIYAAAEFYFAKSNKTAVVPVLPPMAPLVTIVYLTAATLSFLLEQKTIEKP